MVVQIFIQLQIRTPENILSIYVFKSPINSTFTFYRVFIGRTNSIFWFDVELSIYTDTNGISCKENVNHGYISLESITNLNHINGIGSVFYVAGNTYIERYTITSAGDTFLNSFHSTTNTNSENKTLNRVCIYNSSMLLVVGNRIVMKTTSSGTSWQTLAIDLNVKSAFLFTSTFYVFTGEKNGVGQNAIYYSRDGITIQQINDAIMNDSGNANMLLSSPSINRCIIKDTNNILVSAYKNTGSKLYNLYLPSLYNPNENRVLDISGVMTLTGDFEIGGGGEFISKESSVSMFTKNSVTVNIGHKNSTSYFGGNLTVNKGLNIVGDVSMSGSVYSYKYMEANRVGILNDLSMNGMSTLYLHGTTLMDGSLNTTGNVNMDTANIEMASLGNVVINSTLNANHAIITGLSSETIDVSNIYVSQNVVVDGVVKSNYIDSKEVNGDMYIGCIGLTDASAKTIYIASDGTTTQATKNIIRIGGPKDNIVITGQTSSVNIENINAGPVIYLNKLDADNDVVNIGFNSSAGAGIHIVDNSNNDAGKFIVSSDMAGYILKAPASMTKIKMDIGTMGSGILSLKPETEIYADSSFVMRSFSLEPENIMVRGSVVDGKQIVDISSGFMEAVSFGKTENIANTAVDISGNVICTKLGVGTTNVNPDFTLAVEGNVYASGYIWQF